MRGLRRNRQESPLRQRAVRQGYRSARGGGAERVTANPPHALLTADGVWHPLGDLCCMGSYSGEYGGEMARSEWKDMVAEIVDRHLDQVIVCVDCHVY